MIVEDGREAGARRLKRLVVYAMVGLLLSTGAGLLAEHGKHLLSLAQISDRLETLLADYAPPRQMPSRPRPEDIPAAEASPPVLTDIDRATINARWDFSRDVPLSDYMPDKAADTETAGESTVACRWNSEGRVTGCTVISEVPQDYGFGQATLRLLRDHGRVVAQNPSELLTAGEGLKMRFRWVME